jgi:ribosome biogenesis GTPase
MPKEWRTTTRNARENKKRELFSSAKSDLPLHQGLVVSRFGQQADIQTDTGQTFRCHLRKHMVGIAVGDIIEWQEDNAGHNVVVNILPRRSELQRPNPYEGIKTIAANVDHILIVFAPVPAFSEQLLDRYLVAAECSGIAATIVVNKCDRLSESDKADLEKRLQLYRQLDYSVLYISAHQGIGLDQLRAHIADSNCVIIGQSGVGKSSLVNALLPDAQALTGDVSSGSDLGQHTTTASRLFALQGGGHLIDSPGVREFGLWHLTPEQVVKGFREIAELATRCKFRNCQHKHEPGCAVHAAAASGALPAQRFDSFNAILNANAQD